MRWVRGLFKPVEVFLLSPGELVSRFTGMREIVRIGIFHLGLGIYLNFQSSCGV